jgi:SagB-type dehydrogenase family enzyme
LSSGDWRLHPRCLIHPASIGGERLFVVDTEAASPPLILRDHRVAAALSALPPRFTRESALAEWAPTLADDAPLAFDSLAREGVLVRNSVAHREHDEWAADGWWEAALFHHSTRDFPFVPMDEPGAAAVDAERMERYAAEAPPPPPAIDHGDRPRVQLPRVSPQAWDRHLDTLTGEERRAVDGVALLLDVCAGVRREVDFGPQGTVYGKSVPSGGSRHPTELFVVSLAIDGLVPGVYHYSPPEHALVTVGEAPDLARWRHATFDLFERAPRPPVGVVVFASLWERAMWRYRDDRSARAPFIDLGHVIQVFRELAERLAFAVRGYQKSRDRELAELCAVEPRRLTPLYVATLS